MRRGVSRFLVVGTWTFVISVAMNAGSRSLLGNLPLPASFGLLFGIVLVGIIFDVIGVAATAASESPFHAMAADKVPGSVQAIWIVRHADRVASFANDMVGDIAGTLSGAVAATIVFRLVTLKPTMSESVLSAVVLGLVAALTVGGKAYGKQFAVRDAQLIVYLVGRLLHVGRTLGTSAKRIVRWQGSGKAKGRKGRRDKGAVRAKDGRK